MPLKVSRPARDEYADFHQGYLAAVEHESDGVAALERQQPAIGRLRHLTPEQAAFRYADGKWSVKEVVGHLADIERVLTYRLLRIARGDQTPLTRVDEKQLAANSNADRREIADLAAELSAVRASTLTLVRSLDDTVLDNRGRVSEWTLSARALVFIIAGHFAHHTRLLRDKYQVTLE